MVCVIDSLFLYEIMYRIMCMCVFFIGLCIFVNNIIFIKLISEILVVNELYLILEFLEECI